jgi:hypothetical protein
MKKRVGISRSRFRQTPTSRAASAPKQAAALSPASLMWNGHVGGSKECVVTTQLAPGVVSYAEALAVSISVAVMRLVR